MTASFHQELWQSLGRDAVAVPSDDAVGYYRGDGAPRGRTAVIRRVDEAQSILSFVTDLRSPTIAVFQPR